MSVSWLNGKELTKQETFPLLFQINPTSLISFNLSKILHFLKLTFITPAIKKFMAIVIDPLLLPFPS